MWQLHPTTRWLNKCTGILDIQLIYISILYLEKCSLRCYFSRSRKAQNLRYEDPRGCSLQVWSYMNTVKSKVLILELLPKLWSEGLIPSQTATATGSSMLWKTPRHFCTNSERSVGNTQIDDIGSSVWRGSHPVVWSHFIELLLTEFVYTYVSKDREMWSFWEWIWQSPLRSHFTHGSFFLLWRLRANRGIQGTIVFDWKQFVGEDGVHIMPIINWIRMTRDGLVHWFSWKNRWTLTPILNKKPHYEKHRLRRAGDELAHNVCITAELDHAAKFTLPLTTFFITLITELLMYLIEKK